MRALLLAALGATFSDGGLVDLDSSPGVVEGDIDFRAEIKAVSGADVSEQDLGGGLVLVTIERWTTAPVLPPEAFDSETVLVLYASPGAELLALVVGHGDSDG